MSAPAVAASSGPRPVVTVGMRRVVGRLEWQRRQWSRRPQGSPVAPVSATEQAWRAGIAEGLRLAQLTVRQGA